MVSFREVSVGNVDGKVIGLPLKLELLTDLHHPLKKHMPHLSQDEWLLRLQIVLITLIVEGSRLEVLYGLLVNR